MSSGHPRIVFLLARLGLYSRIPLSSSSPTFPAQSLTTDQSQLALRQVSKLIFLFGFVTGLVLTLSILSGDAQGRVNLLYLLLLFVFLPVTGLLLSLVFVLRKGSKGLAGWILELPFWPATWRHSLHTLSPTDRRRDWLFFLTQLLSLGFAIGSIAAFLLLLLATDISFVWRSTLLEAEQLYPLLSLLAWPWSFWQAAQPDLELLRQSQDFRLGDPQLTSLMLGRWWQYVLAAQFTYNLVPRAIMAVVARARFRQGADRVRQNESRFESARASINQVPMQGKLADVVAECATPFVLLNWGDVPKPVMDAVIRMIGSPAQELAVDPMSGSRNDFPDPDSGQPLIAVKAWEPPMGEIADYLREVETETGRTGLIMPLDWEENTLRSTRDAYVQEWRRFAGTLTDWRILHVTPAQGEGA